MPTDLHLLPDFRHRTSYLYIEHAHIERDDKAVAIWDDDGGNHALSSANACLYGVCHAAILTMGFSPALGFIHTGKQLSFVYDIADLYKLELSVPVAFEQAVLGSEQIERRVRLALRDRFRETRFVAKVAEDLISLFADDIEQEEVEDYDEDTAIPAELSQGEDE